MRRSPTGARRGSLNCAIRKLHAGDTNLPADDRRDAHDAIIDAVCDAVEIAHDDVRISGRTVRQRTKRRTSLRSSELGCCEREADDEKIVLKKSHRVFL